MNLDIILGSGLVVASLVVVSVLTAWSRRMIHRIADGRFDSARRIVRELRNGS